ncbi:alpha/beta hydrolase [Sphingobacterium olei]|uniref:Alpha/beta hydrolase n=1 Tax=Sphingobacterium olei TaxID=2571155 RepID=A0A4U0NLS7_9SPHI|nr:alpha/beta hydrolase [Sphingobacterium olei]TJZ54772.1 alpha/beta hydrolase [Sphingobacterium olei]
MNFFPIIALLVLLPSWLFAQQPSIPEGWSDGYAYANGIRIHYYRAAPQPDKPVLVMVHGVTDNGLCWTTLALNLQGMYDIYMLDARGHGLSDPFTPSDNGETLIKDVVAFVGAMEFHNPILMGHSMGAATVMRLGADYPDIARAIIMLDPLLGRIGGQDRPARNNSNPDTDVSSKSATAKPKIAVNMFGSPQILVTQNNYSFEDLIALGRRQNPLWGEMDIAYWALSKKQYHGPYTSQAAQAMTATMNIGNALSRIEVPAIILKADASAEVREKNEDAAAAMPKGKLVHIDGGGHNLHHDKLERTTEVIEEFLSTL